MNRNVRIDICITTQTDSGNVRSFRETFNVVTDNPALVAAAFLANLQGATFDVADALTETNETGERSAKADDLVVLNEGGELGPDRTKN